MPSSRRPVPRELIRLRERLPADVEAVLADYERHLRLERNLLVATIRMCIQLILVGYVLTFLFAAVSLFWTTLAAVVMILFASREVTARQKRQLSGLWSYGLGAGCTLLAGGTVTIFALLTQLRPEPWYHPRYALPLLGMILGNTMTGISLGLDVLTNGLVQERAAVEARLALGAHRYTALLPVVRDALRSGAAIESSDIVNSELIRRLSEQSVTLRAQFAEQSSTLLAQHPRIKEMRAHEAE